MKQLILFTFGLIALLAALTATVVARAQSPAGEAYPVVIALSAEVSINDAIVRVDQIAKLSGGSPELRRRIAKLDVVELKASAERTTISANQVKFRLLLGGIAATQFRLTGAKQVIVTESDEPITSRRIVASAESALRQKYPGDAARVLITPAKSVVLPVIDVRANDRVEFDAKVNTAASHGKARVDVAILVNGKTRDVVPVHLEITLMDALTTGGTKDFGLVPAGGITAGIDPLEIIIKNRDFVKIVAIIGAARIEATGEALQDGKIGEVIRVRNTESNRVVSGRIEARGIVLVDY